VVTGQSGQVFSPHYQDHWQAWYTGTSFLLPFSQPEVEKAAAHKLTLRP
jgi:acyl-homoserine lactone acylase PvdQ